MPVAVAERVPSLHMVVPTEPYVLAEGRSPGVVRSHCTASGVLRVVYYEMIPAGGLG